MKQGSRLRLLMMHQIWLLCVTPIRLTCNLIERCHFVFQRLAVIESHGLFRKFILYLSREAQCRDVCVCLEGSHTLCLLGKPGVWNLSSFHVEEELSQSLTLL